MKPEPGERSRSILFLGTHGQHNVGDELLLETFLAQIGDHHHYRVNSYDPRETNSRLGSRFDVDVFDTAGPRLTVLKHLLRSDLVIFGGGSIIKELYPSVGRWKYATMTMILATVVFARIVARKPVMLSSIGVGPIDTMTGRLLARAILAMVDLVSVRDSLSYQYCRDLGCGADKVRQVPDAVWVNDSDAFGGSDLWGPTQPCNAADTAKGTLRIALNLNRDIENSSHWNEFVSLLGHSLNLLANERPIEVHALPMQCRFKEQDDLTVLRSFFDSIDTFATVLHKPTDHRDVAALIAECDVVVSERLHAIVIAAVVAKPVVALPYDVKVRELAAQVGLNGRSFDVNQRFEPSELAVAIAEAANDESEGTRLAEVSANMRTQAQSHFETVRSWVDRVERPNRRLGWSALDPPS